MCNVCAILTYEYTHTQGGWGYTTQRHRCVAREGDGRWVGGCHRSHTSLNTAAAAAAERSTIKCRLCVCVTLSLSRDTKSSSVE